MIDIKEIDTLLISKYINLLRTFFISKGFEEIVLSDITTYNYNDSEQIKTTSGERLRNTTEPEIWEIGMNYDKFFCIPSLFRNEKMASDIHKKEFKIIDFYIKESNEDEILDYYIEVLQYIEQKLDLFKLSELEVKCCNFEEFEKITSNNQNISILKVRNYPITESFFDAIDENTGQSKKGELFFLDGNRAIEFGVFGQVGENKNPNNCINSLHIEKVKNAKLYGMCLGIERIIFCYEISKYL